MPSRLLRYCPLALVSTACSVYTPLRAPAPLIDGPQQVELSGGVSTPGYVQGTITYSPLRHVLLRAAGGNGSSETQDSVTRATPWRMRQLEAALGTYWRPSPTMLLGGFAGYGRGTGTHDYTRRTNGGFRISFAQRPDSLWVYQYRAGYQRLFADVYAHWFAREEALLSMGFAYRVEHVRFDRYTNAGEPTGRRQLWRHEPVFFARLGSDDGDGLENLLHGQFALGYSFSPGFTMTRARAGNRDATEVRKPLPSFALSLILRPHVLWQRPGR